MHFCIKKSLLKSNIKNFKTINSNSDCCYFFIEAVKKHRISKNAKRNEIEKCVAKWLRDSRDCDGRRIKRSKANSDC